MPVQWLYSSDGQRMLGPCTSVEMKHLASIGEILPTYRVQRKGRKKRCWPETSRDCSAQLPSDSGR